VGKVELQSEIVLRRPPALVAGALASGDLIHAWRAGVVASHQLDRGPVRVGAQTRVWRKRLGVTLPATWTLTAYQPGRAVVWVREGRRARTELRFDVDEAPGGARVRVTLAHDVRFLAGRTPDVDTLRRRVDEDLTQLRRWLDDGQHGYPARHDRSVLARVVGATVARGAGVDLRVAIVSRDVLGIELDRRHATCQMHCVFCPRTAANEPRDLPPPDGDTQASILAQVTRALDAIPSPELTMWSDDLLRYPGLPAVLELVAARGVRLVVHTPGLELADRSFARQFAGRAIVFDLTVHAHDPATFAAMCGNPAAHAAVFQAIDNLAALGVAFKLGVVVTDRNVAALGATLSTLISRYTPERLSVRVFYPDSHEGNAAYEGQFPEFAQITAQLLQVREAAAGARTEIALSNLPPCQLHPEDIRGLRIRLIPNLNAVRIYPFAACEGCKARSLCSGVHPHYARTHTIREPDAARVGEVLGLCAVPRAGASGEPGPRGRRAARRRRRHVRSKRSGAWAHLSVGCVAHGGGWAVPADRALRGAADVGGDWPALRRAPGALEDRGGPADGARGGRVRRVPGARGGPWWGRRSARGGGARRAGGRWHAGRELRAGRASDHACA
jgi:hypothetical protein